ncbi:MAG: hypothetical protein JNN17_05735 [Verrucomicrobiaceae bacterium]|nr:hypothetical protein [Verrucomicrobiaceae bacterium]
MSRPRHYSPTISRFLVSVLYHESKHQNIPMTKLTDKLLLTALRGSPGWIKATTPRLADENTPDNPALSKAA